VLKTEIFWMPAMIVYGPHKNTATSALQQVPCALLSCAMGDVPKAGLQLCLPELRPFAGTRSQKQTLTVAYQKLPPERRPKPAVTISEAVADPFASALGKPHAGHAI